MRSITPHGVAKFVACQSIGLNTVDKISYVNEHLNSSDLHDGCGNERKTWIVPEDNLKYKVLPSRLGVSGPDDKARRRDRMPKRNASAHERNRKW